MTSTNDRPEQVFVTPRVIDQNAFDDLAGTLRRLIDQAQHAGRELEQCVEQAGKSKGDQHKSAERLQERLRLSARMLKAFQSQIVRTESAIAELTSHQEKTCTIERRVEQQVEQAIESVENRLNTMVDAAIDRFNQQLEERIDSALERVDQQIASRADRLESMTKKIDAMTPAAERLTEVAENAEVIVASMAHHAAMLVVDLDDRGRAIEHLIGRGETVSQQLEQDLGDSAKRIEEISDHNSQMQRRLEIACERGEAAHKELMQQVEAAHAASRSLAIDVQACEALETLLEQLKPWEMFVLDRGESTDADAVELPEPAARLVHELRRRLEGDLEAFSSVLAHVADQFRMFADRDRGRESDEQDRGDETSVVSVIRPDAPLSFSSHANISRAE